MKSYSVAKYKLESAKKHMVIYYSIFITVCVVLIFLSRNSNSTSSGIEMSTAVFMFVLGLNFFKESFYFSQSNNISRKVYFKGTIISILPIVAIASFIDIIINRVYNLFSKCPTNYDMIFTSLRDINMSVMREEWVQNNDIATLFNTFLFQLSVYAMVLALGLVITMIYYKCNKLMKTAVSISPVILIFILNMLSNTFTESFRKIGLFIQNILGLNTQNPYAAIVTFTVVFIILVGSIYLLIKKAVIKER